jgi:hypothetical protein
MLAVHIPQGRPPNPHNYWRVYITAAAGPGVSIGECQMYDAAGTLLSTGGTASASSTYPGYSPSYAFDGNVTTFWPANGAPSVGSPEWLKYQFPTIADVAVVRITRRSDVTDQQPVDFKIQYSDNDSTWTDATGTFHVTTWSAGASGGSSVVQGLAFAVNPSAGTYPNWRIRITAKQSGTGAAAAELEFRETAGGADLTSTETFFALASRYDSAAPAGAFDNSAASSWSSSADPPQWIGFALRKSVLVAEIAYTTLNTASFGLAASAFTMQGSLDGVTWTDAWSGTFGAWAMGETKIAAKP